MLILSGQNVIIICGPDGMSHASRIGLPRQANKDGLYQRGTEPSEQYVSGVLRSCADVKIPFLIRSVAPLIVYLGGGGKRTVKVVPFPI